MRSYATTSSDLSICSLSLIQGATHLSSTSFHAALTQLPTQGDLPFATIIRESIRWHLHQHPTQVSSTVSQSPLSTICSKSSAGLLAPPSCHFLISSFTSPLTSIVAFSPFSPSASSLLPNTNNLASFLDPTSSSLRW